MGLGRLCAHLLPTVATFGLAIASAMADDPPPYAKLKEFLSPGPEAQACFARTYDAKHLQKHPKQKVAEMVFFLRYEDEKSTFFAEPEKPDFRYVYTLAAKLRGNPKTLHAAGECLSAKGISCVVECDGGGVAVEPKANEPDAVLIRLDTDYGYISMGSCDGDTIQLEPGEDDKEFKLTKTPLLLCRAMQEALEKDWESQSGSEP